MSDMIIFIVANTLLIYWCCDKNDKNRIKITFACGFAYMVFNGYASTIINEYYSQGATLCLIELYCLRPMICGLFAQQKLKLFVKQISYWYVWNGVCYVIGYVRRLIIDNKFLDITTTWELKMELDDSTYLFIGLIVTYILIRIRLFERIKYVMIRNIMIVVLTNEIIVALGCILAGGTHFFKLQEEMYLFLAMGTLIIICIVMWYQMQKNVYKTKLYEEVIGKEYYNYERIYYQQMAMKNIRHNLANHIQVMKGLSIEEKEKEQQAYRNQLIKSYNKYFEIDVDKDKIGESNNIKITNMHKILKLTYTIILSAVICVSIFLYDIYKYPIFEWISFSIFIILIILSTYFIITNLLQEKNNDEMLNIIDDGKDAARKWSEVKKVIENSVGIGEGEEAGKCISQSNMDKLASLVTATNKKYSVNEIANVMLNCKDDECKTQNIETDWHINIPTKSINEIDIVELLSNLIDNAIEACKRIENDSRYIKIDTFIRANYWFVCIENSKSIKEQPVKSKFKTSKKGEHGLGLGIVKSIVKKYDGVFKCEDKGKMFKVELMIQVK